MTELANAVAETFVAARRDARMLSSYPGERPADLRNAYQIQDRAILLDGRKVAGWKVGRINPPDDERLGCNRIELKTDVRNAVSRAFSTGSGQFRPDASSVFIAGRAWPAARPSPPAIRAPER